MQLQQEIEESYLGAVLLDGGIIHQNADIVTPELFTDKRRDIYGAMVSLAAKNTTINILTLGREIDRRKIYPFNDAALYLSYCTDAAHRNYAHQEAQTYARLLVECNLEKKIRETAQKTLTDTKRGEDVFAIMERTAERFKKLAAVAQDTGEHISIPAGRLADKMLDGNVDVEMGLFNTGLSDIDDYINYFDRSQLIVIAGERKTGKTRFMLQLMARAVAKGLRARFSSLEMTNDSLAAILAQINAEVPARAVQTMQFRDDEVRNKYYNELKRMKRDNVFFDSRAALTLENIESRLSRQILKSGCDVLFLDYIQLIAPSAGMKKETEELRFSDAAARLKRLANEYNICVFIGSQLNAEGYTARARAIMDHADKVISITRTQGETKYTSEATFEIITREGRAAQGKSAPRLRFDEILAKYILDEPMRRANEERLRQFAERQSSF